MTPLTPGDAYETAPASTQTKPARVPTNQQTTSVAAGSHADMSQFAPSATRPSPAAGPGALPNPKASEKNFLARMWHTAVTHFDSTVWLLTCILPPIAAVTTLVVLILGLPFTTPLLIAAALLGSYLLSILLLWRGKVALDRALRCDGAKLDRAPEPAHV